MRFSQRCLWRVRMSWVKLRCSPLRTKTKFRRNILLPSSRAKNKRRNHCQISIKQKRHLVCRWVIHSFIHLLIYSCFMSLPLAYRASVKCYVSLLFHDLTDNWLDSLDEGSAFQRTTGRYIAEEITLIDYLFRRVIFDEIFQCNLVCNITCAMNWSGQGNLYVFEYLKKQIYSFWIL